MKKSSLEKRLIRVEYASYVNAVLIASHIGIPLIGYLWITIF